MKFTLTIELGNDAMQTYADIFRAIREHKPHLVPMSHVARPGYEKTIRDVNGNAVGKWEVSQ